MFTLIADFRTVLFGDELKRAENLVATSPATVKVNHFLKYDCEGAITYWMASVMSNLTLLLSPISIHMDGFDMDCSSLRKLLDVTSTDVIVTTINCNAYPLNRSVYIYTPRNTRNMLRDQHSNYNVDPDFTPSGCIVVDHVDDVPDTVKDGVVIMSTIHGCEDSEADVVTNALRKLVHHCGRPIGYVVAL